MHIFDNTYSRAYVFFIILTTTQIILWKIGNLNK